jgi:hypothetical protein
MAFLKIGNIWRELEKTKKMGSMLTFQLMPFRNVGKTKMKSQNLEMQIEADFLILPVQFFIACI